MKTKLLFSALLSFSFYLLSSQVPQGFNYQAIARDGSGNPIAGATIKVKLSILSDTSGFFAGTGGTYIWEEEQTNVKTNTFGLFTVVFGNPSATKIQGTMASFSAIDWSKTPLFIGTKIANPTNYKNMGSAKLWSVPYSMVTDSTKALLKGSKLSIVSSDDQSTNALFEVKRKDGQTVFAVYSDSVNVYVPNISKGSTKGGFAIGGFDAAKGHFQNFFRVTPDSVRVYIDTNPTKGATKGGFAIGGFDAAKTQSEEYLRVTRDSTRVYINNLPSKGATKGGFAIGGFDEGKGNTQNLLTISNDSIRMYINDLPTKGATKGGFAIGGFDGSKGTSYYMDMTPKNYFIGESSGKLTTGLYNSFLGFESGIIQSTGAKNVFLGYHSGMNNSNGSYNVFLGNETGLINQADYNTFLGYQAGYLNTIGSNNLFIGYNSGFNNDIGLNNIFLGNNTGKYATDPFNSVIIGHESGSEAYMLGVNNIKLIESCIYIGTETGKYDRLPFENIFIGYQAGKNNINGGNCLFLGDLAGRDNKGISNLFIGNASGIINEGNENMFIGWGSGQYNTTGSKNLYIGYNTGILVDTCSNNIFCGYDSGDRSSGNSNIFIGTSTGFGSSGSNNIFIGTQAGYFSNGSDKLVISNSQSFPLILGDFKQHNVGIGTIDMPTQTLDVNGNARFRSIGSGTYNTALAITSDGTLTTATSDISMKKDIVSINQALQKVMEMNGVYFSWKNDNLNNRRVGFIAQEMEKVLPEVVFTNPVDGLKGINYPEITAVLAQAVKEQQQQIESTKQENQKLRTELDELKTLVNTLIANQTSKGNN
jgi:trimeric autotransporter adhesin